MTTTDTLALRMHVANDHVWYVDHDGYAQPTKMAIHDFFEGPIFCAATCVHVVGTHSNARLITKLYELKRDGQLQSVKVVTPLVCKTVKERQRPEALLLYMPICHLAPSQGGLHEVVAADYHAYALAAEVQQCRHARPDSKLSPRAQQLLRAHPVWHHLSFIKGINPTMVAGLLAQILDPRWYIDGCAPDRSCKLEAAMGLNPKTQAGVTVANFPQWRHHRRCKLVLHSWKDLKQQSAVRKLFEITTPIPVEGSDRTGVAPCDFAWRIWGMRMGYGLAEPHVRPDPVIADLRASQRFIRFLRYTWLGELYAASQATPEQQAPLFRPADFFKHPSEIAAYELHQLMRKQTDDTRGD